MTDGYRAAPAEQPMEQGAYTQLKAFARARGLRYAGGPSLTLEDEGQSIVLSYSFNSGTVDGYEVTVPIAETPEVLLRPETDTDRTGKERRINHEAQVGETEFDRAIYIETGASDDDVRRMLPPDVRAAVLALASSAGVQRFQLGQRRLVFTVPQSDARDSFAEDNIERVVTLCRAFTRIPHVDPLTPAEGERGNAVVACAVILTIFGVGFLVLATVSFPPEDDWLWMTSVLVGLVLWFFSRTTVARATRGHSRSYRRYLTALSFAFVGLPTTVAATAIAINAGFDRRPELVREGSLAHVAQDEEGTMITVRWSDGTTTETNRFVSISSLHLGARVIGRYRKGALGARWRERRFEVVSSAPPRIPTP